MLSGTCKWRNKNKSPTKQITRNFTKREREKRKTLKDKAKEI